MPTNFIVNFFVRLWATIQCIFALDIETPEDKRRARARARVQDYKKRKENKTVIKPIRIEKGENPSNRMLEAKALSEVIKKEYLYNLKAKSYLPEQYYKLYFANSNIAYAYVQASEETACVFLYEPNSSVTPYKAFWLHDGEITRLVEMETIQTAERLLSPVVKNAA